MSKVKLMTQAEYAQHRGCSAVAVHKAVKAGRISLIGDKIDPAVADIQWAANTRARQRNVGKDTPAAHDLVQQAQSSPAPAPEVNPASAPPADTGYTAARARREMADAENAEIDVRKKRGELVAAEDVARAGFEIGRDLRDAMESSVNSLAAEVAALPSADTCADVLRRHNRALCDVLVKAWRERLGAGSAGPAA